MLQPELKAFRARHRLNLTHCGAILGMSAEAYRKKELADGDPKRARITGAELALLADAMGESLSEAFPSYRPTGPEKVLARHIGAAA